MEVAQQGGYVGGGVVQPLGVLHRAAAGDHAQQLQDLYLVGEVVLGALAVALFLPIQDLEQPAQPTHRNKLLIAAIDLEKVLQLIY